MNTETSSKKKSLALSGIKLTGLIFISRILGLVREMTKARFLGTSELADAFGIAFLIPNLCRRLFAENSISVAFIPTFRGYIEDAATDAKRLETKQFIAATFTLVSFLTAVFVVLGMIFTPLIVRIFFNKTDTSVINETVVLTRIMFPYLFVISIAAFFQGILNGVNIFSPSGFTPILFNTIVISATYILAPYSENPARAMSIGVIAGGTVQALFQLPFVIRTGWTVSLTSLKNAFTNPGSRKVISLVGPTIIGMAAYQLNDIVSTALAGKAGEGIVSSLQYSLRLQELILGVFAVSIASVILPDLSGLAKRKEWDAFGNMLSQAIRIIILITVPVTFFSLVEGRELISLVYKSRRFTEESVVLTLTAFKYHILGLTFIALNRIIAPAFYAQGNTKLPTLAGIIGFGCNIIIALLLVAPMQGGGIALALTLASFANTIFLFIFLRKTPSVAIGSILKITIGYTVRLVVFSLIASVPIYFLRPSLLQRFSTYNRLFAYGIPLLVSGVIFAAIGVVLLILFHDPAVETIIHKVQTKLKRG
ncbi:MAG: murein biosynthesis integral membrane protein MurJ [Treponema sp.]|nr:murein biosynthesis integral membrane protein MurJ [Treponema sp.]